MPPTASRLIPLLLSLLLLLVLLSLVGWDQVLTALQGADLLFLSLALLPLCLFHLVMALRLSLLAGLPFLGALKVHCSAMLLSELTPGRVGYLGAMAGLRYGEGMEGSRAIAVVSAPFLVDGLLKVILAVAAFTYFFGFVESLALLAVGAVTLTALGLLLLFHPALPALIALFPMPAEVKGRLLRHVGGLQRERRVLTLLPLIFLTAIVGWLAKGLFWFILSKALHISLSMMDALLLQPLATMPDFLPFTIAGSGATEAGGVALLSLLGVDAGAAAALLLLRRLLNILPLLPFAALLPRWRPGAGSAGVG